MREALPLLGAVAAIYLIDSLGLFGEACLVLRASWSGRYAEARSKLAVPGGCLALTNPLLPTDGVVVADTWPASVSPEGVLGFVAARNLGPRIEQGDAYVRFSEMRDVEARGRDVRVNGTLLARAGSTQGARRFAELLRQLEAHDPQRRDATLRQAIHAHVRADAADGRWGRYLEESRRLDAWAAALYTLLFVGAPVAIAGRGLAATWPVLLALLLVLVSGSAWEFRRVHARLHPSEVEERWSALTTLVLAPPAAVRARDWVTRDLLADQHPLVVARAVCGAEGFAALAERVLRNVKFPPLPVCPCRDPEAERAEAWYRQRMIEALEEAVREAGLDPEALVRPPPPEEPGCLAYCPRCTSQYRVAEGACGDCGGRPLEALRSEAA